MTPCILILCEMLHSFNIVTNSIVVKFRWNANEKLRIFFKELRPFCKLKYYIVILNSSFVPIKLN